jgi:DNA-binding PadR family transcriptional regulator
MTPCDLIRYEFKSHRHRHRNPRRARGSRGIAGVSSFCKAFRVSVGHVWHAPDSQIYPELKRPFADGLVDNQTVPWGARTANTRYPITDEVLRALSRWLGEPAVYPAKDSAPARNGLQVDGAGCRTRAAVRAHRPPTT